MLRKWNLLATDSSTPKSKMCVYLLSRGYVRNEDGMSKEKRLPACKLVTESLPPYQIPSLQLLHFQCETIFSKKKK